MGIPISTFHVGKKFTESLTGGTSGSPPTSTSPFATLQYQLGQLGGPGGPGQQTVLTPQTLGEDAKRLLQKTGDAVSKPLNALGRIFSEALDNAEDQLKFLPSEGTEGSTLVNVRTNAVRRMASTTPCFTRPVDRSRFRTRRE